MKIPKIVTALDLKEQAYEKMLYSKIIFSWGVPFTISFFSIIVAFIVPGVIPIMLVSSSVAVLLFWMYHLVYFNDTEKPLLEPIRELYHAKKELQELRMENARMRELLAHRGKVE